MGSLEELPNQIAANVNDALEKEQENKLAELEHERIKLERERIKAEERINERNAQRDETIVGNQNELEQYKSFVNDLLSQFGQLLSQSKTQVEIDATHTQHDIPNEAASEDIPVEANKSAEEVDDDVMSAEKDALEGVEEVGKTAEKTAEKTEEKISENVNDQTRNSGRRKRRRR